MSEFFTRPPDIPEEELNGPRIIPPETALTRTVSTVLMVIWAWWWWHGYTDGAAYWVVAAVVIFATGETMQNIWRPVAFLWWPLSFVVRPITFVLLAITRAVIPESYRRRRQVLKPLSFKQINEALDEALEEKERREKEEKERDKD